MALLDFSLAEKEYSEHRERAIADYRCRASS